MLLFAIVYAGFAFQPSTIVIFVLFFIYGIYAAATEGVAKAWITNIAHNTNTATAIGFLLPARVFAACLPVPLPGYYGVYGEVQQRSG